MNGINLMKIFQRAVGWCKTVYGFKCLTREQKPLSGHVIFRTRTASGIDRNRQESKQHVNKSGTAEV